VLSDSKHQPVMTVKFIEGGRALDVNIVQASAIADDRSLELWTLPKGGAPRSLGLLPSAGRIQVKLARDQAGTIAGIPAMAVSLEPKGGSPTGAPTGPVLYSGPLLRL
jgi:anti-sigma-K factor RskA